MHQISNVSKLSFLLFILFILPSLSQAQEAQKLNPAKDITDLFPHRWYRIEKYNQMVGYSHVQLSWETYKGQKLVLDQTEFVQFSRRKIAHMNDVFTSTTKVKILRTTTGEIIREETSSQEGKGRDTRYIMTLLEKTDTGYSYTISVLDYMKRPLGSNKTKHHKINETITLDSESALLPYITTGKFDQNSKVTFNLLNGQHGTIYKNEATYYKPETIPVAGVQTECMGVEVKNVTNNHKHFLYFRKDGLLTRIYDGDTTILYCTEDEIQQKVFEFKQGRVSAYSLPALETAIHTSPDLPGAFNLKTFTLEVAVKKRPRIDLPVFPENQYQELLSQSKVENGIAKYVLKLKAFNKDVTTTYPIEEKPEFKEHLKPTPLMQVDHPLVQKTAKKIVQNETDARVAAQKIADYVYLTLRKGNSGVVGQYSAVEILKNKYGDCSEHCLLFTTLCRAAGIPAKRASGLVCLGNLWGPHAWSEIWVGDWIGADPTTGDIGNVARYIFVGYPDDPYSNIGAVTRGFYGYSKIQLLGASFGEGQEVDLRRGKEQLYGVTQDLAFNHISGVSLKKIRPNWRLSSSSNRLGLNGKHINVDIYISPDQGARHLDRGNFWIPGKVAYPIIQGVRCKMGDDKISEDRWRRTLFIPSARRSIFVRARLNGTAEEREAAWNDFLNALHLSGWKGIPHPYEKKETPVKEQKAENWEEFFNRLEKNF